MAALLASAAVRLPSSLHLDAFTSAACRKESTTGVFSGRGLREANSSRVEFSLSPCCCLRKGRIESDAEGSIASSSLKGPGVGLLIALITFTANGPAFASSDLGLESSFDESQAGVIFEENIHVTSSGSGGGIDSPRFSIPLKGSLQPNHLNEVAALSAVQDVTIPSECSEEAAASIVPKEEVVEEVSNGEVVEEAWQVVNENFLDARHNFWSSDAWLKKKQEALKSPLRSRMAAYSTIRNMLSSLNDPYTRFLAPDQFSQLSKYDVTGIGLNIGESANANGKPSLKVFGIVLGSPAQLAGVRQGDELLAVGGNSVSGKTAFEAASLIQGPKGTLVSIKIRHGPCGIPQDLEVERQQDVRSPVYYRLERVQDSKQLTGYIHLKEFNALAKRDLVTAIKRMQDAGASSFVLDLRDNPGGLVQAGIETAMLFLDEGETVVETVGRDPSKSRSIIASHPPLTEAPLTILVNDHTASASEIVAAALHDNCRALLVGKRTFGKGLIQAVYELSDGSGVILTVGTYATPRHQDIDRAGIEPDLKQLPGPEEGQEKLRGCRLLKASSEAPKVGDNIKSIESGWICQQLCGIISHMCQIAKIESV